MVPATPATGTTTNAAVPHLLIVDQTRAYALNFVSMCTMPDSKSLLLNFYYR